MSIRERLATLAGKHKKSIKAMHEPEVSVAKVERDRSRKNSRTKGNSYERKIAKKFSAWSGEHIRRTPMSGGWSNAKFGVTGDLVCDNEMFPFHVECKKREGWMLEDLLTGTRARDTRSIIEWWNQCCTTCPKGKWPTLVFSRNGMPDFVMLHQGALDSLTKFVDFTIEFLPKFAVFNFDEGVVVIMALDDFFLRVRPPKGCRNRKKWQPGDGAALVRAGRKKE